MNAERIETALENQFTPVIDGAGYVISGTYTRERSDGLSFLRLLRDARARFPFDPTDIVYPPLWIVDEDGRGLSVLEMTQILGIATMLQLNSLTRRTVP